MTKELVISSNRHETKLAVVEDDQLVEIYFQRSNEYSLVGSIHKGRVTRVLPGMQSAFVEIGLERDAFLYVSDFFDDGEADYDRVGSTGDSGRRSAPRPDRSVPPPVVLMETAATPAADAPGSERVPPAFAAPTAPAGGPPQRDARDSRGDRGQRGDRDARNERGGRRSRRRRSRGQGFPENKYASPETGSAPYAPARESVPAPLDARGIVEEVPAVIPGIEEEFEALVLPGESLAKYRARPVADAAQPSANFEPDAPAEAEDEDQVDQLAGNAGEPEALAEPVPEAVDATPVEETVPVVMPEAADLSATDDETVAEDGPTDYVGDESSTEEDDTEETEEESAEELAEESGEIGGESVPEVTSARPLEADLREQPTARYIVRGQRRVRRRGGRPDSGDSPRPSGRADRPERSEHHGAAARPDRPADRERPERGAERDRGGDRPAPDRLPDRERPPLPSIADLLKEGQEIIVQIAKEPLGQKGARITSHLAMPGRYVVYMPTIDHAGGVSRKISSDEERQRLKRILQTHSQGMTGGFIVRTAGEGRTEAEIAADMTFLFNQWMDIRKKAEKRPAPLLLHHDLELVTRTLRDQVNENFKAIWVDNEDIYENVLRFLERFQPALVNRVKLYTRDAPILDTFNITSELEKALRPKVWLKSGGYIVINQTEALVAIDINTGKYVGKSNRLEDTIVKTNVEAIKEIVRQVRLRDLGGIIVVDFIDMDERKNRQKVMQALEEAMRTDRAPYKILQFNDFGLVAITRRRVKQSLERALCSSCPTCEGAGYVKAVPTVVSEIISEAYKIAKALEGKDVMLRVHPDVAKFLKSNEENYLEELEEIMGRQVIIKSDPLLHPEKFDLA